MKHLYGNFTNEQMNSVVFKLRKSIFGMLLAVENKDKYQDESINEMMQNLMFTIGGMNDLLSNPTELVYTLSLLQSAKNVFNASPFEFRVYRKLILDAGNEILKICKEGDSNGKLS